MKAFKRTKIVATVGPACQDKRMLEKLARAGVNAFRLNFSHGTREFHLKTIQNIRQIRERQKLPLAILQDLSGPKIRIGEIQAPGLKVAVGDTLILDSTLSGTNVANRIGVNHPDFARDVYPGARLLLADGELELKVVDIKPPEVWCRVIIGGILSSHKGVNFPSGSFSMPALTEKDKTDLRFGLAKGVDAVALSFVRSARDLDAVRKIFQEEGRTVPLLAKIEKHEAVENIEEILESADGVMLARGDLGVEIEIERIPLVQKRIIALANRAGKPVITATQMLRSMVDAPRPTRAEVTDVANAIFDGTDAIMLSEETAVGKYPERAVSMMTAIARQVEENYSYLKSIDIPHADEERRFTDSVAHSAVVLARDLDARFLFAVTRSGYTARILAKFRPESIIVALTPHEEIYHSLALVWGVIPVQYPLQKDFAILLRDTHRIVRELKLAKGKDRYVLTSGFPLGEPGSINQVTAGQFV